MREKNASHTYKTLEASPTSHSGVIEPWNATLAKRRNLLNGIDINTRTNQPSKRKPADNVRGPMAVCHNQAAGNQQKYEPAEQPGTKRTQSRRNKDRGG